MKKILLILILTIVPATAALARNTGLFYVNLPIGYQIYSPQSTQVSNTHNCHATVENQSTGYGTLLNICKTRNDRVGFKKQTVSWTTKFAVYDLMNGDIYPYAATIKCQLHHETTGTQYCTLSQLSAPNNSSLSIANIASDNGSTGTNGYVNIYFNAS